MGISHVELGEDEVWGLCWVLNPLYSPSAHHRAATGPQTSSLQVCVSVGEQKAVCMCVCGRVAVCLHTGARQKRVHGSWVFALSILCTVLSAHVGGEGGEAAQEYVLGPGEVQGVEGSTVPSFPLAFRGSRSVSQLSTGTKLFWQPRNWLLP